MDVVGPGLYKIARWVLQTALGFYFSRIEYFHRERVPLKGPVLFASNHPNSVTDAFVIGTSVPRKVNFVGTVQLFRLKPVRWLLTQCGVIPINRMKDDPRAMRTVLETFEACFQVLERGEAIGIFPEGITHDDPQLKTVKTGAARLALELEHRHGGRLGLRIVPVGLNFSAKETYRSEVLVNFGAPIRVAEYLDGYAESRHNCIHALNAQIEQRIQSLMLHLPKLERARVVEAVKRLYLERLWVGLHVVREPVSPQAGELLLTQGIAHAVDEVYQNHPERAAAFVQKLDRYERWLKRLKLSEEALAQFPEKGRMYWQSLGWTALAVAGLPVALYGGAHRWAPISAIRWAIGRYGEVAIRRAGISTAAIIAGIVSFSVFYGTYIAVFHLLFGWPTSLYYALSLPVAGLVAHYYARELRRFTVSLRTTRVLLRAPLVARRMLALRSQLISEIEQERKEIDRRAGQSSRKEGP